MLDRWRAARACGCGVHSSWGGASEKSNIRMWWVWMGIRPLRGRDSVCPLSAGSLRSPAVRHGSASPRPLDLRSSAIHLLYIGGFPGGFLRTWQDKKRGQVWPAPVCLRPFRRGLSGMVAVGYPLLAVGPTLLVCSFKHSITGSSICDLLLIVYYPPSPP